MRFGQHTYAVGGNSEASLRAGIPVRRHVFRIYVLSATLASIAGFVYSMRFTNGAANAGDPLLLDSIAAVVIGGASLFGGAGTIFGTVIGALDHFRHPERPGHPGDQSILAICRRWDRDHPGGAGRSGQDARGALT